MSKCEVLERLYDEAMNKVFASSANYLMTVPRKGMEREWQEYNEIADVLKELLEEEKPYA